jgi:hypothetical protein
VLSRNAKELYGVTKMLSKKGFNRNKPVTRQRWPTAKNSGRTAAQTEGAFH